MRILLAAALTLAPVLAQADTPEEIALEARKGFMQMLGVNMGILAGMAKGDIAYDEAAAVRAATNIEALSSYDLPMHLLAGTAQGEMEDSEALPAIWQNPDDFGAKFAALGQAAAGAGEKVKGGQANIGPVVGALGGACKACHDTYRAK